MKKLTKVLAVAALGLASGAIQAAQTTATFTVSANVQSSCSVSATDLVFGNYTATAVTALDAQSTITVTCTAGEDYDVDVGANPTTRSMSGGGGSTLNYGLFLADYATGFGYTARTGTGAAENLTVYGRVPAGQFLARAGAHTDTVTVTITY